MISVRSPFLHGAIWLLGLAILKTGRILFLPREWLASCTRFGCSLCRATQTRPWSSQVTARTLAHQLMDRVGFEDTEEAEVEYSPQILDRDIELLFDDQQLFVILFIIICTLIFLALFSFVFKFDFVVIVFESVRLFRFRYRLKSTLLP